MCSNKWGYVMHILDQVHTTNCGTGDQVSTVHPRVYSCWCVDLNITFTLTYLVLMLNFSWRYRCLHKDDQTWRKGWGFIDNCLTFLSGWYANGINQNQMFQNNLIQSNTKQIKTPNNPQMLGLKLLDEPSAQQTDPSVLELHLRWKLKYKDVLHWPNQ